VIDGDFCRMMARYNAWQNKGLRGIVQAMPPVELDRDRGAFFGSILATLNHLLWADQMWMSRFEGTPPPAAGIKDSVRLTPTAATWEAERFRTDGRISLWAEGLGALDLAGPLTWYSGILGRELTKPKAQCVAHFFNHQTHHRGQVHAMLTAAGQKPQDTDLIIMPEAF
jgi:uncharacterized damage-inducible protein DinB